MMITIHLMVIISEKEFLMVLISCENTHMALMLLRIYLYSWSSFLERISSFSGENILMVLLPMGIYLYSWSSFLDRVS